MSIDEDLKLNPIPDKREQDGVADGEKTEVMPSAESSVQTAQAAQTEQGVTQAYDVSGGAAAAVEKPKRSKKA